MALSSYLLWGLQLPLVARSLGAFFHSRPWKWSVNLMLILWRSLVKNNIHSSLVSLGTFIFRQSHPEERVYFCFKQHLFFA